MSWIKTGVVWLKKNWTMKQYISYKNYGKHLNININNEALFLARKLCYFPYFLFRTHISCCFYVIVSLGLNHFQGKAIYNLSIYCLKRFSIWKRFCIALQQLETLYMMIRYIFFVSLYLNSLRCISHYITHIHLNV